MSEIAIGKVVEVQCIGLTEQGIPFGKIGTDLIAVRGGTVGRKCKAIIKGMVWVSGRRVWIADALTA
jgi:hypothetical protein